MVLSAAGGTTFSLLVMPSSVSTVILSGKTCGLSSELSLGVLISEMVDAVAHSLSGGVGGEW